MKVTPLWILLWWLIFHRFLFSSGERESSFEGLFSGQREEMSEQEGLGARVERKFSVMSETALLNLDSIERTLEGYTQAMLNIDEQFNTSEDVNVLVVLKNELIQLMGNIEKLQFNELDAVVTGDLTSGKDATKTRRKKLNNDVSLLQQSTQSLFNDLTEKINTLSNKH